MPSAWPPESGGLRQIYSYTVEMGQVPACVSSLPELTINSPVTGTQSESPLSQPQSLDKCKAHIGYIPQLFVWGRVSIWDQHWAGSICHPETSIGDLVTLSELKAPWLISGAYTGLETRDLESRF